MKYEIKKRKGKLKERIISAVPEISSPVEGCAEI
jgi:hypothetical protein